VVGEDVYGTSPGMDALGDVKQLQLQQKRKLEAIDKWLRPPLNSPPGLRIAGVSILPGDVNYVDRAGGSAGVEPVYQVRPEIKDLVEDMRDCQGRIRSVFYADLFQLLTQGDPRDRTAREIQELHEEKLLMLGPVLERLNTELLDGLIDRTFAIMLRQGLLEDPPEELQGQPLRVEYISILASAQRMVGTSGIERLASFATSIAPAQPDILDKVDFDQAVDEYANMLGVPPRLVRPDDAVAALRKQKQAMQQAAATAAPLKDASVALKNAGDTPMDGDTALTRMLGLVGPAAA
jgi:hypothetical protein